MHDALLAKMYVLLNGEYIYLVHYSFFTTVPYPFFPPRGTDFGPRSLMVGLLYFSVKS